MFYLSSASSYHNKYGIVDTKDGVVEFIYDEWSYDDTDNIASGKNGDSRFAAYCFEVACLYSRLYNISITQVK